MENRKNNNNILLTIIGAATLLVAMIGATFAYFSASSKTDPQKVRTGELKIKVESQAITQANIKPTVFTEFNSEEEPTAKTVDKATIDANKDVAQLPITVTTTGTTIDAFYNIYLTTTSNGKLEPLLEKEDGGIPSDIQWLLAKKTTDTEEKYTKVAEGTFGGDMNKHKINSDAITITGENVAIDQQATTEKKDEYILLIWINETNLPQNQLQEITLTATVDVEANQTAANLPQGDGKD